MSYTSFLMCLCSALFVRSGSMKYQVVDLTYEISDSTVYWPGGPPYEFRVLLRGRQTPGFWLEKNYIGTPEHGGTHVDAPAHFWEGAWRAHQIPMENLCGPAVVIDVKAKAAANRDYRVTMEDINQWETKYGKIPQNAAVIMNSGWGAKYPNKTEVFGTTAHNDSSTFHFPSWHEDAVRWLIDKRFVRMIGVDSPSIDGGQAFTKPVHQIMGKENKIGLEFVANVEKLPSKGAEFFAPVIKTKDGSGGPARLFALIFENHIDDDGINSAGVTRTSLYLVFAMIACCFLL